MSSGVLKSYLFVVDSSTMTLSAALDLIDKIRKVENWHTILPDAAVLISRLDITELQNILHEELGTQKYLLTALERGKKTGWLQKSAWEAMNKPTSVYDKEG